MQARSLPMELLAMHVCWHLRPPAKISTRALIGQHLLAPPEVQS